MKSILNILLLMIVSVSTGKERCITEPDIEKLSSIRGYEDFFLDSFRCGVYVPPSYSSAERYPLVVYLHGHGDTTTWNLKWYNEPLVSSDPCIILTPKCPRNEREGWGDSFHEKTSPMMDKTFEMISLAEKAFTLDTSRYYIYGTSMGGFGTFAAIRTKPGLFTAAYVKCGGGNPEMAPVLVDFPLWIFHGAKDKVVSVKWSRNMYRAIKALGGNKVKYTEYEGVGHNIWDYPRNEIMWLLAQRKGAVHGNPDPVNTFSCTGNDTCAVLTWEPPADTANTDNQVWYYNIFRNGKIIREVDSPATTFTDSSIVSGNTYEYKVTVVNFFFKESEASTPVIIHFKH